MYAGDFRLVAFGSGTQNIPAKQRTAAGCLNQWDTTGLLDSLLIALNQIRSKVVKLFVCIGRKGRDLLQKLAL